MVAGESQKIRSLTYDKDFSDLAFSIDYLREGKHCSAWRKARMVTREFSQAKSASSKYLHENLGYNVLAFEASTMSCYLQEQEFAKTQGIGLSGTAFSVWDTKSARAV